MKRAVVIGGGPAGLMAAEVISAQANRQNGIEVAVYDAMPSVGRKFLLAGKGGLNLTHSEPLPAFTARYGVHRDRFARLLADFGPDQLRSWAAGLGISTFIGTSGRVFPDEFKAAPLMRAWVRRLRAQGVAFHPRHRWTGFAPDGSPVFMTPDGEITAQADAILLALGGGSWARLGSDGAWIGPLSALGCHITPLRPANCGFLAEWTAHMQPHFGHPLKNIALSIGPHRVRGEAMITAYGIEGGAVYALSAWLRDAVEDAAASGQPATLHLDLKPDLDHAALLARLSKPCGRLSLSNWLRKAVGLTPAAVAVLRETTPPERLQNPADLCPAIKDVCLPLTAPRPMDEAISTAGGLAWDELDDALMLRRRPGLFCAGEMLDWEAPTGGYLLTGCFSTGWRAGKSLIDWLSPP